MCIQIVDKLNKYVTPKHCRLEPRNDNPISPHEARKAREEKCKYLVDDPELCEFPRCWHPTCVTGAGDDRVLKTNPDGIPLRCSQCLDVEVHEWPCAICGIDMITIGQSISDSKCECCHEWVCEKCINNTDDYDFPVGDYKRLCDQCLQEFYYTECTHKNEKTTTKKR